MKMNSGLFSSNTDEWATPKAFFQSLDAEFHFDLDPCANAGNAKCRDYYTIEDDGLTKNWGGAESVLQPTIRKTNREMGRKVRGGIEEAGHTGRYAYPRKDRHRLLSSVHLQKGKGNPFHSWTAAFQRGRACAFPFDGSDFLRRKDHER